ncbi:hypothetical protein AMK16_31285 [Streptomyces sp. CB00455]|uniref:hypothetical protein n=1 Tax=Streptomyces sp. CB00455 TaxID=1703927 RepID=UPI00093C62BD|nr:hypothetical protein [Streptomyces sp. CB00455]OKK14316.1 hypothetical protein AMK16_31285 [Streptomyces sp. CB00455]
MHLVDFALTKPPSAPDVPADAVLRALWDACEPGDRVEHLRVHTARSGARGVAFLIAPDAASARAHCHGMCRRALARSAALPGWELARPA